MKFAIALLPVLALMCYAAPDVYVPWTYPGPGQATFQERNPYPLYQPVQEQDVQGYESDREYGPVQEQSAPVDAYAYGYPSLDNIPAAAQSKDTRSISVDSPDTTAVEAVYQTPDKGRVSLFLRNPNDDILIVIDARVDWYSWKHTLVLNSKTAHGSWQQEAHPSGFPFPCCGYVTRVTLRVEMSDSDSAFIISANGKEITKYPYREGLRPPISSIEYMFDDTGASKKAKLESLSVYYMQ